MAASLAGAVAAGRVNGPAERALSTRLGVKGYPSILLFREGSMREYEGAARSAAALERWARGGYAATPRAPYHRTPNNALGRALGRVFALPSAAVRAREHAQRAWGLSDGALAALCVAGALGGAAAAIGALDCALALGAPRPRPHHA
jgi:hypothetical protein